MAHDQITFQLEGSDLWAFGRLITWSKLGFLLRVLLLTLAVFILTIGLTLIVVLLTAWHAPGGVAGAFIAFALIFLCVMVPYLAGRKIVKRLKSIPGVFDPQTLSLNQEGVKLASSAGEREYSWAEFMNVVDEAEHIYYLLDKVDAIIIPKRAFASAGDAQGFYEQAYTLWANSSAPAHVWPPAPEIQNRT